MSSTPDPETRRWLHELRGDEAACADAQARLHHMLHGIARAEAYRRSSWLPRGSVADLDHLALEAANDALAAVLRKLDTFRGDSRFTTWAYKFAVFEVSVRLRRRAWQGRRIELDENAWERLDDPTADTEAATARRELLSQVRGAVASTLTEHQRYVFLAAVVEGVPIDVLAERSGGTRGAVYKTLHDARRKLRAAIEAGVAGRRP